MRDGTYEVQFASVPSEKCHLSVTVGGHDVAGSPVEVKVVGASVITAVKQEFKHPSGSVYLSVAVGPDGLLYCSDVSGQVTILNRQGSPSPSVKVPPAPNTLCGTHSTTQSKERETVNTEQVASPLLPATPLLIQPHPFQSSHTPRFGEHRLTTATHAVLVLSRGRLSDCNVYHKCLQRPGLPHHLSLVHFSRVLEERMELRLLCEDPVEEEIARGVAMEVQDLALSHVLSVHVCSDVQEAFEGAHVIFVLDHVDCPAESCSEEMEERSEGKGQENLEGKGQEGTSDEKMKLLQKSGVVFKVYKDVLSSLKDKPRKVIVSGPFAALGVSIISPAVDMCVALAVLTCQQAASIIAERLSINPSHVRGVAVWGGTRGREAVLDLSSVVVHSYKRSAITGPEWFSRPLRECVFEGEWLNAELPQLVEQRWLDKGDTCVPPPLAEGVALVTFVECWEAESSDHTFSVALCLNDVGDFPSNVAISVPCCLKDGKLELNLKCYQALDATVKERLEHSIELIK